MTDYVEKKKNEMRWKMEVRMYSKKGVDRREKAQKEEENDRE